MAFKGRSVHLARQRKIQSPAKRRQRMKKAAQHQQEVAALLRRLAEQEKAGE